jgi:hypothetical protein
MLYIFSSFIVKSSIYAVFCFVARHDIYFIFTHDLTRIFISQKQIPDPFHNQMAIP